MQTLDANIGKEEKEIFFEKLRGFVGSHESALKDVLQTFDTNRLGESTVWDSFKDSISIDLQSTNNHTPIADTLGRSKLHNGLFFRMAMLFPSLVLEMKSLTEECYDLFIPPLVMFAEYNADDEEVDDTASNADTAAAVAAQRSDERAQKGLGRVMSLLSDIWHWVQRVQTMTVTVIRNLAALYSPLHAKDNYQPYLKVHFPLVWHALIDMIGALVALEEVLKVHETLRQGLRVYRKMIQQIVRHKDKFEADVVLLEQFGKLMNKVEADLLDDGMLERLVSLQYDSAELEVIVTRNNLFYDEFTRMFANIMQTIGDSLCTPREGEGRRKLMGLLGLHYLQFSLFKEKWRADPAVQRKTSLELFELHRKVPVVYIDGDVMLKPAQWMAHRMPAALKAVVKDPVKEAMMSIKTECVRTAADFLPRINFFSTIVTIWSSQMQSSDTVDRNRAKSLITTLTQLVQRGIFFAQDINRATKHLISIHQAADMSLTLPLVDGIAQAVEMLHMIRAAFHNKFATLGASFHLIVQHHGFQMQRQLFILYQRLNDTLQNASEAVTDQHSAIGQSLALLNKGQTAQNLACLDIVLCIAFNRDDCHFQSKDFEEVMNTFSTLTRFCKFQKLVRHATDCDFLYWQREGLVPVFFKRLYANPSRTEYLPYLMSALHDCRPTILSSRHVATSTLLLDKYVAFVKESFIKEIIKPLRTDIENDLRLYTHAVVLGQPFRKLERQGKDLSRFTKLPPFRFFNESLRIADLIEDYLDSQFYNLNALMTNDWKTYEEMRNIALERYGLRVVEGFLPGSIVDQGLDVLVITENIQFFVANYTYNLNEQLFVQRPSVTDAKNLHTLHIRHVANSIRTHGSGIMNTTVNYVYKCLLKKLAIVSQFLYDDHVKSRLMKDTKHFAAHKEQYQALYPLQRAEKYNVEMRKLGVSEDGRTFLDQFRQLVAEIGNALGYMRMVRSGGLRAISDAAVYIPAMDAIPHLEKKVNPKAVREGEEFDDDDEDLTKQVEEEEEEEEEVKASDATVHSCRVVDRVISHMSKKLAQGSDYFHMLQDALAKKLKDPEKYGHLKHFYMIVPSICISHVEYMVRQKEQLVKKNKDGLFTDDGFALGCVFLLCLFGVLEPYESLHWFESVSKHYIAKLHEMSASMTARNEKDKKKDKSKKSGDYDDDDNDIKTMQLTFAMAEYALKEYQGLERCFTSCLVFFQRRVPDEADEEEEEEEE